jgi:AraC-like DNA-binding protein
MPSGMNSSAMCRSLQQRLSYVTGYSATEMAILGRQFAQMRLNCLWDNVRRPIRFRKRCSSRPTSAKESFCRGNGVSAHSATMRVRLKGPGAAEAWRQGCADAPRARAFETIGPEGGFTADYMEQRIGEIVVADARCGPMLLRERPEAAGPLTLLQAVVEGNPVYQSAQGDTVSLKPGQLIVRRCQPGAVLRCDKYARVVTVFVAQHLLAPRFATAVALNGYTLLVDNALPPRLLYSFVVGLADADTAPIGARVAAIEALGGLLSMVLAQLPQPPVPVSELTARRAADVLGYLKRNFANPLLTPAMMAEELGISVRYAHKLMGMIGRSFRQELIAQRLDAARAAFAANLRPRQTIADIAISVGFNDLSQFNRHFRTAFGMTPRVARRLDEVMGYAPESDGGASWDRPAGQGRPSPPAAAAPRSALESAHGR